MACRRRSFLLLELTISMVLFGAIIWVLIFSQRQIYFSKAVLGREKETILAKEKLQLRLAQIFSTAESVKLQKENYLLKFDNGVDDHADYRGVKDGMLYLSKNKLCFVTWSDHKSSQVGRVEQLFEKVASFSLLFFDPKKGSWSPFYSEEKSFMAILKLHLTDNTNFEIPLFL